MQLFVNVQTKFCKLCSYTHASTPARHPVSYCNFAPERSCGLVKCWVQISNISIQCCVATICPSAGKLPHEADIQCVLTFPNYPPLADACFPLSSSIFFHLSPLDLPLHQMAFISGDCPRHTQTHTRSRLLLWSSVSHFEVAASDQLRRDVALMSSVLVLLFVCCFKELSSSLTDIFGDTHTHTHVFMPIVVRPLILCFCVQPTTYSKLNPKPNLNPKTEF